MQQPFCFSRSFAENSAARTCPRRRSCVKIQIERRACARPRKKRKLVVIVLQTGLRRTDTDMTRGSVLGQLVAFSVPLLIGNIFQQLYNTVDSVVVGNFVGKEALAAVGSVGPVINMLIGFFNGFATGAGVVISRHYGARQRENVRTAVQTTIAMTILMSIVLSALGVVLTPALLRMMQTPEEVLAHASEYLQIYFAGLSGLLLYNMGAGILRAVGDSRRPLFFLISATMTNIVLDVVFIAVFGWGVMGAALATVLSQVASAVLTLRCIVGSQGMPWHIRTEKLRLHGDVFTAICTIGVPAAAQSAMYNISNMFIQSSMNSFGTSTIAAWGVYGKIDFLFWMTINSLGIAITTFAGQNFGARQYDRVRRGVRVCLAMAACTTLVISFTFYNLAEVLFRLFSQDDAVVAVGVGMMHVLTPVYITYVCIEVLAGALRGCGDVRIPTLITVFFVCGLRMLWLFVAVPIRHEVATVELSYPITWTLASALFIVYYLKGGWMQRCAEKWEKKQKA